MLIYNGGMHLCVEQGDAMQSFVIKAAKSGVLAGIVMGTIEVWPAF